MAPSSWLSEICVSEILLATARCNPSCSVKLNLKFDSLLIFEKESVPLLVSRLWAKIVLKALAVPDVSRQVLLTVVSYQIG